MENGRRGTTHRCGAVSETLSDAVLDYIGREYAEKPFASKLLARLAKTSHRTAERWLARKAVPTGENFMNLLVQCEGLAEEIMLKANEQRRKQRGE